MSTINGRRISIGFMLILILVLVLCPVSSFASSQGQVGSYVSVDKDGNIIDGTATGKNVTKIESGEGTYVEQSKTISTTDVDDVFKIDLKVKTNEIRKEVVESIEKPHDIAIILDISGSMDDKINSSDKQTKWQIERDSIITFINGFLTGNDAVKGNRVAIGTFSGQDSYWYDNDPEQADDDHNSNICGWTTNASTAIETIQGKEYAEDMRHTDQGAGTNMEAGFIAADEMLKEAKKSSSNDKIVIYVGDGMATYHYDDDHMTEGSGSQTSQKDIDHAIAALNNMKSNNPGTKLFTLGIGASLTDDPVLKYKLNEQGAGVDKFFSAIKASDIEKAFEEIREIIVHGVDVWKVEDPMSKWVEFKGFDLETGSDTSTDGTAKFENGKIGWNLEAVNAVEKDGVYTYTLSYFVKLDKNAEGFKSDTFYPTNKITSLEYAFKTGDVTGAKKTSEFMIPTVRGDLNNPDDEIKGDTEDPNDQVMGDEETPDDGQKVLGDEAKTEDAASPMTYVIIMLIACAAAAVAVIYRKAQKVK